MQTTTTFGDWMTDSARTAYAQAVELADVNGSPCCIWTRDGWFTVDENPPDDIEPNPELIGWVLDSIIAPDTTAASQ